MISWALGMVCDKMYELIVGTMMSLWPFTTSVGCDGCQFCKAFARRLTPFADCRPLRRHCLGRSGHVKVIFPLMPSRPELPSRLLAGRRRAKEQIQKSLHGTLTSLRIGHRAVLGGLRLLCRLP